MIDRSDLYMPPRNWPDRAEDWYKQVNRISDYVREEVAQEIEIYMNNYFDDFSNAIKHVLVSIARGKKWQ